MVQTSDITEMIRTKLKEAGHDYPTEVSFSADDEKTLCINIFSVPESKVIRMEDMIFDIQDELGIESEYLLLPMVRDIETTRKHYAQYIVECSIIPDDIDRLFNQVKSEWKELGCQVAVGNEGESLDIRNIELFIKTTNNHQAMQQVDTSKNASYDEDFSRVA